MGVIKVVKQIDQVVYQIMKALLIASVLLMSILLFSGVVSRVLFKKSIVSSNEICNYCINVITFGCSALVVRIDKQVRITYLFDHVGWGAKKTLGILVNLGMTFLSGVLAYYSFLYGFQAMQLGSRTPVLNAPICIRVFIVAIGLLLLTFEYFVELILTIINKDKIYIGRKPLLREGDL